MADEKVSIFREKTVESIQSPEVLDDYLRVTAPGVWLFLGAVVCLLIGVLVWGILGTIQATVDVVVVSEGDSRAIVVPYESAEAVMAAGEVEIEGVCYAMNTASYSQGVLDNETDPRILIEGGMSAGDYVVSIDLAQTPAKSGVYAASVVTESIRPMSLLMQ